MAISLVDLINTMDKRRKLGKSICIDCKYAEWKMTENGTLHPSGDGMCKYECSLDFDNLPELPVSMWWDMSVIKPSGGKINRLDKPDEKKSMIIVSHNVYYCSFYCPEVK